MNPTPVSELLAFGLVIVNDSAEVSPTAIDVGVNELVSVGGLAARAVAGAAAMILAMPLDPNMGAADHALMRLGPDYRFTTRLVRESTGDLVLTGSGDPSFSGRVYPYAKDSGSGPPLRALEALNLRASLTDAEKPRTRGTLRDASRLDQVFQRLQQSSRK